MNDDFDEAIAKLMKLTVLQLQKHKSATVAEELAKTLLVTAIAGDSKSIQVVADRTGGRAAPRKKETRDTTISDALKKLTSIDELEDDPEELED